MNVGTEPFTVTNTYITGIEKGRKDGSVPGSTKLFGTVPSRGGPT